jgi:hypothetical protein
MRSPGSRIVGTRAPAGGRSTARRARWPGVRGLVPAQPDGRGAPRRPPPVASRGASAGWPVATDLIGEHAQVVGLDVRWRRRLELGVCCSRPPARRSACITSVWARRSRSVWSPAPRSCAPRLPGRAPPRGLSLGFAGRGRRRRGGGTSGRARGAPAVRHRSVCPAVDAHRCSLARSRTPWTASSNQPEPDVPQHHPRPAILQIHAQSRDQRQVRSAVTNRIPIGRSPLVRSFARRARTSRTGYGKWVNIVGLPHPDKKVRAHACCSPCGRRVYTLSVSASGRDQQCGGRQWPATG